MVKVVKDAAKKIVKGKKPTKSKLGFSDNVMQKKKQAPKINKFNYKVNRCKFPVFGRDDKKGTVGNPVLSKSKAFQKRSQNLLKELEESKKCNTFINRKSERAVQTQFKTVKKNKYLLDDDIDEEWKDFSVPRAERFSSDDEESGDEEMTDCNFGNIGKDQPQTRAEYLQEKIAETKRKKREKQVEREENHDLCDSLKKEEQTTFALLSKLTKIEKPLMMKNYEKFSNELKQLCYSRPEAPKLPEPEEIPEIIMETSETDQMPKSILKKDNSEKKTVKTIKFYEPKLSSSTQKSYNVKIFDKHKKLEKKVKKESRGAIKELRLDNQFLASIDMKKQLEQKAKNEAKMKQLTADINSQKLDEKKYAMRK